MVTKTKRTPARAAIESLKPLATELRTIEKNLVGIEAQAASIPREAGEEVDRLLGKVYQKHSARLKVLGLALEDPGHTDLRNVLDAFKTIGAAFGVLLDTSALPRTKPEIWTSSEEYYAFIDDKHVALRPGLKLAPDGSVAKAPRPKNRLKFVPPLLW